MDRALNAYILSVYCARVCVNVDVDFQSIRITTHQAVFRETIKGKYPQLEFAPLWEEYFGNGDRIFVAVPNKHPKVFEAISDLQVNFSEHDIEQWPVLAKHSGKRYRPMPNKLDWVPFTITPNYRVDDEDRMAGKMFK